MKWIFFMLAFSSAVFVQNTFAQVEPEEILNAYYQLKDNLVKSNTTAAAASAGELVKAVKGNNQPTNKTTMSLLSVDANAIAQSKDIKIQREKFATLSNNMIELAKAVKLSAEPVYQQYCPMKKTSWLSNEKAIKNPYFGNAMLTCGSVKATL